MKSIEIKVPRNLIQKFYQHPEPYGDGSYVVDLINGMYTDVFYREEGDFVTITNDSKLISYLKKNQVKAREYFSEMESIHYVLKRILIIRTLKIGMHQHQSLLN